MESDPSALPLSDIAFFIDIDKIMAKFRQIWAIPLAHGSKVLALTVPRAAIDATNLPLVQKRNSLNQKIKDHKEDGLYVPPPPPRVTRDTGYPSD